MYSSPNIHPHPFPCVLGCKTTQRRQRIGAENGLTVWARPGERETFLVNTILQGTVKEGKKTRQTEKDVGRQHRGLNRPEVLQVAEGSDEQRKMEGNGCEVICGAPTIPPALNE